MGEPNLRDSICSKVDQHNCTASSWRDEAATTGTSSSRAVMREKGTDIMRTGKGAQPKRRALIVDDDELICDYAEIALTAIGFEVQKVLTGEAALDAIQASPPSLVLLDIRLPGMSGLEVLQRMQAMQAPLPVFIGMSVAWESTEREALSLGAAAFLAKPFTIPGLVQTVEAALDGRFVWIDD